MSKGVAGNTQMLTVKGYESISALVNTTSEIWNGSSWSKVLIRINENDVPLYRVELSDRSFIDCSSEEVFRVVKDEVVNCSAEELKCGDTIKTPDTYPIILTDDTNAFQPIKIDNKVIPYEGRLFERLLWLSQQLDREAGVMQITLDDLEWLRQIKLFSNTLGVSPFIATSPRGYHLRFNKEDVAFLLNDLMMPLNKKPSDFVSVLKQPIKVLSVTKKEQSLSYTFYTPQKNGAVLNGILIG